MFNSKPFNGKTKNGVDIGRTFLMPDRKNNRAYFIVANRSVAHILERSDRNSAPTLIKTLNNPAGRVKLSDLLSDGRGRVFESTHTGTRSGYENSGVYDEITQDFCRTIAREMGESIRAASQLILVASPQILGGLRQQFARKSFQSTEILNFSKDLSSMDPKRLPARLKALLET